MNAKQIFAVIAMLFLPYVGQAQQFTEVTIKASASSSPPQTHLQVLPSGELIGTSIPVVELISLAYAAPVNPSPRLTSLPEWTVREHYDIRARTLGPLRLDAENIQTQRQTIAMLLQKLLSDRFGLVLKIRTIAAPAYALTLSAGPQKLTKSTIGPTDCIFDTSSGGCHSFTGGFGHPLNANAVDMFDLAQYLENWTDLPVVDRTQTTGLFRMHSEGWLPMNLPPPPPGTSGPGGEFAKLSTLSTVLSGFGLALHRQEQSLPFYTVKRIHKPITN